MVSGHVYIYMYCNKNIDIKLSEYDAFLESPSSGAPSFVNYKKGCTQIAVTGDKVYQLLAHGRWFSPGSAGLALRQNKHLLRASRGKGAPQISV
jgi:hypothetical protein